MDVVFAVLNLIGSVGLFLYGMMKMSDSLQKVAGDKMRNILAAMTSTPIKSLLTGALITTVIQSSSATTVMIVSFVNAGLMTLTQSVGVILGANIGTTVTAWIISLLGFKADISALALPIIAIGVPLMMMKSKRKKTIGDLLIGFALLFIGLSMMKANVPDLSQNPQVLAFLQGYTSNGMLSVILFVIIGSILTIVIQSSSATMALTLVICANGWIPFEIAAAMVLGENIGTTITANLAAMVANISARRAALAHTVSNVFGVTWCLILFYPFLNLVALISEKMGAGNPFTSLDAVAVSLALFHSMFNITNALLLIGFSKFIVAIVTKILPQKETQEEVFRLQYITTGMMSTAALSLHQAKMEICLYSERCSRMFSMVREMLNANRSSSFDEDFLRIEKYESISDRIEVEIAKYLTNVNEGNLSELSVHRIQGMYKIIDDIESIADSSYNLARMLKRKKENKINFNETMMNNLNDMFYLIQNALDVMNNNLKKGYTEIDGFYKAYEIENEINQKRATLREQHINSLEDEVYSYTEGTIYIDLINEAEQIGDYIINVSEAVFEIHERSLN